MGTDNIGTGLSSHVTLSPTISGWLLVDYTVSQKTSKL